MKIDMHCHLKGGSIDSKITALQFAEKLLSKGIDAMLVTDHDTYKGYNKAVAECNLPENFRIFAGIEYDTKDAGHFLVILPDGIMPRVLTVRGMSVKNLVEIVHHLGGILGPAHPFGARSSSMMFTRRLKKEPSLIWEFDFFEGLNGCETEHANMRAKILARKYRKPVIGGSDAHKEEYAGICYSEIPFEINNNNQLINAIKSGAMTCRGRERKYLPKHKKRNSFAATWGFKGYNRTLGLFFSPYRRIKLSRAFLHKRDR